MTAESEHGTEPSLHQLFINFRTMEPRLRVLTGIITAQVAASAILLLLREFPMRQLPLGLEQWLGTATIPAAHYVFSCAFVFIGLALFMTGLMEAGRRGAIRVLGLIFVAYALIILGE